MRHAAVDMRMSAEDFLAWDQLQAIRHEFVRGEVFAMAGGEDSNAFVALNIASAARAHLRGTACKVIISEVKLRVEAADSYFYPDVMITCSAADAANRLIKREPLLAIEVLSPSTAAYDRGEKFAAYRQIPTLREYALVDPRSRRCDVYRKGDEGLWVLHPFEPGEALVLASIGFTVGPDTLWEDVPTAE
jgi:Uma2 family endonuclease